MYPNPANFNSPAAGEAWWKVDNPEVHEHDICSTTGWGFLHIVQGFLRAAGLNRWGAPDANATPGSDTYYILSADLDPNAGIWNRNFQSLLAAWFRQEMGGDTIVPLIGPGIFLDQEQRYARLVGGMPMAAQAIHRQLRTDYERQQTSETTLRVMAWIITRERDMAAGGRPGTRTVEGLARYEDVTLGNDTRAFVWNRPIQRNPNERANGISCVRFTNPDAPGVPAVTPGGTQVGRAVSRAAGATASIAFKLAGTTVAAGILAFFVARAMQKRR